MNTRRIVIIALIVLIVVFGGILVYFLLQRSGGPPIPPDEVAFPRFPEEEVTGQPTPIPEIAGDRFSHITDFPVIAPTISPDGNRVRFFERSTGNIFEANFNGSELTKISDSLLADNISSIIWSPPGDRFVALFEEITKNFIYTFETGLSDPITKNVATLSFSPRGNQIVYQDFDFDESKIITANIDGSRPQTILRMALPGTNLQWVDNSKISLVQFPSGLAQNFLLTINPVSGALNQILDGVYGLIVNWSPSGKKFLYSSTDRFGRNLALQLFNENGDVIKRLQINTLADKCVWSQDNRIIYCTAPSIWPGENILPDDYYKGIIDTNDSFVRINTDNDEVNFIFEFIQIDTQDLILTPQEDYLIFINRKDGLLYSIKL